METVLAACMAPLATFITQNGRERRRDRHRDSIDQLHRRLEAIDPRNTSHIAITNAELHRDFTALATLDDPTLNRRRKEKVVARCLGILLFTVVFVGTVLPMFLPADGLREAARYVAALASVAAVPGVLRVWVLAWDRWPAWHLRVGGTAFVLGVALELLLAAGALVAGTPYHHALVEAR